MSHYSCIYCGGAAAWFTNCCWRCKPLKLADIEREAEKAAAIIGERFRAALDQDSDASAPADSCAAASPKDSQPE